MPVKVTQLSIADPDENFVPYDLTHNIRFEKLAVYEGKLEPCLWTPVVVEGGKISSRMAVVDILPKNVLDVGWIMVYNSDTDDMFRISGKDLFTKLLRYCPECGGGGNHFIETHQEWCSQWAHYVDDHYDSPCMNGRCKHCNKK